MSRAVKKTIGGVLIILALVASLFLLWWSTLWGLDHDRIIAWQVTIMAVVVVGVLFVIWGST